MTIKTTIDGDANYVAGHDINIAIRDNDPLSGFKELFDAADMRFKQEINSFGKILRFDKEIEYSSKKLFTSLMQIGLPFEAAIGIPLQIIPVLADQDSEHKQKQVSTADIRVAVANAINGLCYTGKHTDEQVKMWSATYIRKYGNPENQFVKVIDHGKEKELNYEFIKTTILPHLLERIIGLEKWSNPLGTYRDVFSAERVSIMADETVKLLNALNVYSIRYKTVIHLLQDIILEPPHPWLVSSTSIMRVTRYNNERASYHLKTVLNPQAMESIAIFNHAARECIMHFCASILSSYGAFLGVGSKYGMVELKRMIKLQHRNPALWTYCRLSNLEDDLAKAGVKFDSFKNYLNRIVDLLHTPDDKGKFEALASQCKILEELCKKICPAESFEG